MRLKHVFGLATCGLLFSGIWVPQFSAFAAVTDEDSNDTNAAEKDDAATSATESDSKEKTSAESPAALENIELKVNGTNAIFAAERDLSKGLTEAASLKKKAKLATKPVRDIQQEITNLEGRMLQAEQQLVALNAQLANVSDVVTNNRLVGTIEAIEGQMSLAQKNIEALKKKETESQSQLNKTREAFVQQVLDLRTLADQLTAAYETGRDSGQSEEAQRRCRQGTDFATILQPAEPAA